MTQSSQCPKCGGAQINQEARRRNPKNGNSVGAWYLGCLVQLLVLSGMVAVAVFALRALWLTHPFAEAALLIGSIAVIYLVGVGTYALGLWRWPIALELTCGGCGHKWYTDISTEPSSVRTLEERTPTG